VDQENSPRWDADKQRIFGPAELTAVGLAAPSPGEPVANEWWRVTDGDDVAGYGWLDSEWGDARITFLVAASQRGPRCRRLHPGAPGERNRRAGPELHKDPVPATKTEGLKHSHSGAPMQVSPLPGSKAATENEA
jgi:hypothetical protein